MSKKGRSLFSKMMDLVSTDVSEKGADVKQTKTSKDKGGDVPTQKLDFESSVPDRFRSKTISPNTTIIRGGFNEEFYNHLQAEIKKNQTELILFLTQNKYGPG